MSRLTRIVILLLVLVMGCMATTLRKPSPTSPRLCVINNSLDIHPLRDGLGEWFRVYQGETRCEFFRQPDRPAYLRYRNIAMYPIMPSTSACWTWTITTARAARYNGPVPSDCLRERKR